MPDRIQMTKDRVTKLQVPKAGRATYYDAEVQELAVRVTAAGSRTWYVVTWSVGRQRWISLGGFPKVGVDLARELAREALVKLGRKQDPVQEKRDEAAKVKEKKAGGKVPLTAALAFHLKDLAKRGRDAKGGHVKELDRVVQAAVAAGVKDLADKGVAAKARKWLDDLDVSEPTRHRYRVHLLAVTKTALANWPAEVLPRDPLLALRGKGAALPVPAVFNPAEAVTLVSDKALALSGGRLWAFLLLTGCRFKEATWARWDRINLDRATFDVVPPNEVEYAAGARVKRMKPRTVHLGAELVALLTGWKNERGDGAGPFLFSDEWRTRPHVYNTDAFRAHLAALDIPLSARRIHTLRHTRQTLGLAAGEDSLRLRLSMGHAGEDMGAHYGRLAMRWRGLIANWNGELKLRDPIEAQRVAEAFPTATCPSTDACTVSA